MRGKVHGLRSVGSGMPVGSGRRDPPMSASRSGDHQGSAGERWGDAGGPDVRAVAVADHAGHGEDGGADRIAFRQAAEIRGERLAKAAMVADRHMGDHADRSTGQKGEARIGPADVRK